MFCRLGPAPFFHPFPVSIRPARAPLVRKSARSLVRAAKFPVEADRTVLCEHINKHS